jgi:hypothetical protein
MFIYTLGDLIGLVMSFILVMGWILLTVTAKKEEASEDE